MKKVIIISAIDSIHDQEISSLLKEADIIAREDHTRNPDDDDYFTHVFVKTKKEHNNLISKLSKLPSTKPISLPDSDTAREYKLFTILVNLDCKAMFDIFSLLKYDVEYYI